MQNHSGGDSAVLIKYTRPLSWPNLQESQAQ